MKRRRDASDQGRVDSTERRRVQHTPVCKTFVFVSQEVKPNNSDQTKMQPVRVFFR